jgi:hypothetical protein
VNKHLGYIRKGFLSAVLMLVVSLSIVALGFEVLSLSYRYPWFGCPFLVLTYVLAFAWINGRHA